ncbi:probable phosphoglycerate mutase [Parafrankia irregularis]|uniref:Probable phosphoglycerate mutase n=1 Tax=Parafrankia irregularis TaxID=795642 RepID=A0A0S4QY44_9ACTN|nr:MULTISPECIES: bifunctional RNase H/acid phosphatase [Parafrankia]MBE3201934.1 bifunctional RNase H/acid phosphatase [Parafrankia sp. CH37]CUU59478.1 probable phosphoglycerate mutase [Parafrankia irregularis]
MSASRRLVIEADGGSRGNPGPAGYGALVRDPATGEVLAERAAAIGTATNNVAEYEGLLAGLRAAADVAPDADLEVRMDSKLVVEQMSGRWKIKHPSMRPLATEASGLVSRFPSVRFVWVPRARNADADRLANEAMDAAAAGRTWEPTIPQSPDPLPHQAPTTNRLSGWMAPPAPPTVTVLLRHGQTPLSVEKRFSGTVEASLTDTGLLQAAAAADRLGAEPFDAVICSPLKRARQTADALARDYVIDEDLRETDFGAWEGLTFAEVRERFPNELNAWLADPAVPPPGGESLLGTVARVAAARDRIMAEYAGGRVLVVSHVTPIKGLTQLALAAEPTVLYRLHLDLVSITTIDWYSDGPAVLRGFNDTHHVARLVVEGE